MLGYSKTCPKNNSLFIVGLGRGPLWYIKGLRVAKFQIQGYGSKSRIEAISAEILDNGTGCEIFNLIKKMNLQQNYNCALCLEAGEHTISNYKDILLDKITGYTK